MTSHLIVRRRIVGAALGIALLAPWAAHAETLELRARDGLRITAFHTPAADPNAPIVLLFHMAGSNAGEYTPIAARLAREGYASLAIDQRSGGPAFGRDNETARRAGNQSYDAALPDLEAALAWARATRPAKRIAVLGSSYASALVFVLASRHPDDVGAVLAFSPGEYLASSVRAAAATDGMPIFITSARDGGEERDAATILAASPSAVKQQFIASGGGVHGASTLRQDANPRGAEAVWRAMLGFLGRTIRAG